LGLHGTGGGVCETLCRVGEASNSPSFRNYQTEGLASRLESCPPVFIKSKLFLKGNNMKPIVVCLCGSTRFKDEFVKANLRETLAGKIGEKLFLQLVVI